MPNNYHGSVHPRVSMSQKFGLEGVGEDQRGQAAPRLLPGDQHCYCRCCNLFAALREASQKHPYVHLPRRWQRVFLYHFFDQLSPCEEDWSLKALQLYTHLG